MNNEIETRFLGVNKDEIIKDILKLGAQDLGEHRLDEIIFYEDTEKSLRENYFIRLRKKQDYVYLTYKSNNEKTIDGNKEIELIVSDFDKSKIFLETIGWKAYRIVEKYRHTFLIDDVVLDIDTWPKIPPYIELESISIESIKIVAEKLNLNWEERFDKDPRFVFKHYGYDFDNIRTVTFDKFE